VKQKGKNAESVRKAATVILSLGVDSAAQVFKYLRPEEIEQITLQIATLDNLSSPTVESTMEEFYNLCIAQKYITEGGIEYAKAFWKKPWARRAPPESSTKSPARCRPRLLAS
jgi:flagellar motor switch protein FliG